MSCVFDADIANLNLSLNAGSIPAVSESTNGPCLGVGSGIAWFNTPNVGLEA